MARSHRLHATAAAAALVVAALSGCSSSGSPSPTPSPPSGKPLPVGKSDLALAAGPYTTPAGFQPRLVITVPRGWRSTHRAADAFDVSRPDPQRDAPAVAVIFLTPKTPAVQALGDIQARAGSNVKTATGRVENEPAIGFDVDGGKGQLVASASKSIAIDRAKGQRIRVLGADFAGRPLIVLIVAPISQWAKVLPAATALLVTAQRG